jgi:thioredoxin 1
MKKKAVIFTGSKCGTCHILKNKINERIKNNNSNTNFEEFSIDEKEGRMEAAKYQVSSLPTVIIFENGMPKNTLVGSVTTIFNKLISEQFI